MGNNEIVKVALSRQEMDEMKLAYEQEYVKLKHRMEHVRTVLDKLGSSVVEVSASSASPQAEQNMSVSSQEEETKRRRRKKRGPKSVWGNFILRRLRQADRPISYAEMIRDAMVLHNLPETKRKNARASILNSAFRLRAIHGRIDTVGEEGKKEKYLVLSKWLNDEGKLTSPYDQRYQKLLDAAESAAAKVKAPTPAAKQPAPASPKVEAKKPAPKKPVAKKAASNPAKPAPQKEPVKAGTKNAPKPAAKPRVSAARKAGGSAKSAGKSKSNS